MKKILLLTAGYGNGHLTASKYIEKALREVYGDRIMIEVLDFVKLKSFNFFDKFALNFYNWSMENPVVWDLVFNFTDRKIFQKLLSFSLLHSHKEVIEIIKQKNPSVVIITHSYWNYFVAQLTPRVLSICLITDSLNIHCTWMNKEIDYYGVIDRDTEEKVIKMGIDRGRVKTFGFPVDEELYKPFDRTQFLLDLNLSPSYLTFLLVIGLGDISRFLEILDYLQRYNKYEVQIIVITGKYKEVYNKLFNKKYEIPTKIVGWVNKMADFIRASDIIISKCGGGIVNEALSAGKPLIVPVFTPGQERGNAAIIKRYGLGYVEKDFHKIKKILDKIIKDKTEVEVLKKNVEGYRTLDSAKNIAKFVGEILNV